MAEIKIAGTLHNTEAIQGDDLHSHVVANANEILDTQKGKKQSDVNADVDAALDDRYTKDETYNKSELNNMITTPDVEYITVQTYVELLAITGHPDGAIYRVANWDGTQVVTNKYTEYSYNGTGYVILAVRDHGIANASDFENPTEAQRDLLPTVGAVKDNIDNRAIVGDIVGDPVEEWVPGTAEAYIDQRIDEQNNLVNTRMNRQDTVINATNSAVQSVYQAVNLLNGSEVIVVADHTQVASPDSQKIYREYGTDSYTDYMFQNSAWQAIATYSYPGVDDEPTAGSEKLVKSGGVHDMNITTMLDISTFIDFNSTQQKNYLILRNNSGKFGTSNTRKHRYYPVNIGEKYIISNTNQNSTISVLWAFVTTSDATSGGDIPFVSGTGLGEVPVGKSLVITIPNDCTHVICSYGEESTGFAYGLLYKVDVKEWSKFSSGEEVKDVSIATEISSGNQGLAKSGDVYNAIDLLGKSKVDIKIGKNLLNSTKYVNKYIDENGDLVSSDVYRTSSYHIPVLPETAYYASANNDDNIFASNTRYIAFYDENKSLLSTLENTKSFTTPPGCYYIKLCWYVAKSKLMLNQGTERGNYEEYSEIAGYPDKNEEMITNLGTVVAVQDEEITTLNSRTADYEETTEITEFTTMPYNLDTDDNLGKFGTTSSRIRAIIPVTLGDIYKLQNTSDNNNIRYALVTTDAGGSGETVPVVAGTSVLSTGAKKTVTIEITQELIDDGCQYLIFNTGSGFYSHLYKYKVITFRNRVDENTANIATNTAAIATNTEDIAEINEVIRSTKDGYVTAKANDLSVDLTLGDLSSSVQDGFPYSNKFGDKYSFGCRVASFVGIMICKGYNADYAKWFEIDGTNVVLKSGSGSIVETVAHGLNIERMLNVNINITDAGVAKFTMQTLAGSYTYDFTGWGLGVSGILQVKNMEVNSATSVLSDCYLTATNSYLDSPVWIFGASFESVANNRWIGQIKNMGYWNMFLNAYPGRSGAVALKDFKRALRIGKSPKAVYFPSSNDGSFSAYKTNIDAMVEICSNNHIELVVGMKADNTSTDFSDYRDYVDELGLRYININLAVHDPLKDPWESGKDTWYDGFLGSDGKHPTELGAKSIAMQALVDFPEIMQYTKDE